MSNKKISYLNRTFDDYKTSLTEYIEQYYPQILSDLNDASIGSWLIDMVATVADNLSFYIDKAYNETNLETANQRSSVYSIARSNGLRVPGPKGAMALCEFYCDLPIGGGPGMPNWDYAPIIKKGTKVTSSSQVFEVMNDINFAEEFSYDGIPNRAYYEVTDSQNEPVRYRVVKKEVVTAGESKIYKQVLNSPNDIAPFMEVVIPDSNVMNVESIIFKDGIDYQQDPLMSDFMTENEESMIRNIKTYRFFEVDSLTDAYRWGDEIVTTTEEERAYSMPIVYGYTDGEGKQVYSIAKGEWKPVTQKFITEFTDKGYLKVIFGSGEQVGCNYDGENDFAAYQISKMVRNNFLGKLPKYGTTMYILYRVGGGAASNVPANTITDFSYLNAVIGCKNGLDNSIITSVRKSMGVTNTYPSVTGKDEPTIDEIKAMIKYNNSAQSRCVTLKDYENRIMLMPPRYGCPFRVSAIEENNKVMIYMLGINSNGTLSDALPEQLTKNIANYLSKYRTINDFVEMKSGKVINISVEVDFFLDKNYGASDVISEIISVVKDYFDIGKHRLGETIYLSMLMKEISNISGVMNLMDLRIFNEFGEGYSSSKSIDPVVVDSIYVEPNEDREQIDTLYTKYVLNSDADAMFEIKKPDIDIRVRVISQ